MCLNHLSQALRGTYYDSLTVWQGNRHISAANYVVLTGADALQILTEKAASIVQWGGMHDWTTLLGDPRPENPANAWPA